MNNSLQKKFLVIFLTVLLSLGVLSGCGLMKNKDGTTKNPSTQKELLAKYRHLR